MDERAERDLTPDQPVSTRERDLLRELAELGPRRADPAQPPAREEPAPSPDPDEPRPG